MQSLCIPRASAVDDDKAHSAIIPRKQWKLKRPDVIISVTGGAEDFDLSTEEKDRIFKAMMDGTRSLDAWFTTGGYNAGVMKCMGEFRAKYNPTAPLIGIASLGVINASEILRGIDISDCTAVKDSDNKGWQRFGYNHANFPSLNSICQAKTESAVPAEVKWVKERFQILKHLKEKGQASGDEALCKVCASTLFVECICVDDCICAVCCVYVCNAQLWSTLPGDVILEIVCFTSAASDFWDGRGQ